MRRNTQIHPTRVALLALTLCCTGFWGCAGEQARAPEPAAPAPVEAPPPRPAEVDLSLPVSRYDAQFRQAEQLLAGHQWMQASDVLAAIPAAPRTPQDNVYLGYLQARAAYTRGDQALALQRLAQLDTPGLNPALLYRILNFRRYIVDLAGNHLEAAQLGDRLLRLAPPDQRPPLERTLWQNLQQLGDVRLQQALTDAADNQWRGWLELARLDRGGVGQTTEALRGWLAAHPGHPAAERLPGGLAYLLGAGGSPRLVALLVPLSGNLGPAGTALREGYLASYYRARAAGDANWDLLILDAGRYPSASAAYADAVAQGAGVLVGPLNKEAVAELATQPRAIPVVALNWVEPPIPPAAGESALVQLSLSPEDEAADLAAAAYGQGARSALIIRPDVEWGTKVSEALRNRWRSLGGTVLDSVAYASSEQYSADVRQLLGIPASEERAREISELMGTQVEFSPRRRQDVDVVFLLSRNGVEARSIRPLLAFHYAGNIPVYATSSIYGGSADPRDRDLTGIRLVEVPWLLDADPDLRDDIARGGGPGAGFPRLNALGADAFLVQSRLLQLQAGPDVAIRGATGLLTLDPQLRMHRQLPLAVFDDGVLKPQ